MVFWYERKLQANENDNQPRNPVPEEEQVFNNYGFKSPKTPPANQHLREFEADLFKIINELEFDGKLNHFQRQLRSDVNDIKSSNVMTV